MTLALDVMTVRKLDTFRRKRNISDYERAHTISDLEAEEMIGLAVRLRQEIRPWLAQNHPSLTPRR